MAESLDFIKDRAVKTISAANQIAATWTFQEKSIADMEASLTAITGNGSTSPPVVGQEEIVSQVEQVMLQKRGAWDTALDTLHRRTAQGVAMSKTRFRSDPAKAAQLDGLTARGDSRRATLDEALEWESAWANIDPTWAPLPANTLPAFKTLRKQCSEDLKTAYANANAALRKEAEKLSAMAAAVEDVNEAWYADATRVFPVGTPEGDMIRSTVPTTYNPPPDEPPAPPVPPV